MLSLFLCNSLFLSAQDPLDYLKQTYPKLTELYKDELSKYPAHYIFAVDVSGTMNQYAPIVIGALSPFIDALPNNDRVDIIPFGTKALPNLADFQATIDVSSKAALKKNISYLYTCDTYPDDIKKCTDIEKAVSSIAKIIQTNKNFPINVIIVLTDFRNDVEGKGECKLEVKQLDALNLAIEGAVQNTYTRSVALRLPVSTNAKGYCLNQLKESVFPQEGAGLEIVSIDNTGNMIKTWFDQLKREIMITKLKAVIDHANRTNPVNLETDIDIDGNVKAKIHWTPNKLYPKIQIDSTYLAQQGFLFKNNTEAFTQTRDSVIGEDPELYLGKIKNDAFGFNHLDDSLHLGLLLPTEYDDELTGLGVRKPLPNTSLYQKKWIFSFFLPFWLTCTILALILLYILGVLNAMKRNKNYKLNCSVTIKVDDDEQTPIKVKNKESLSIGFNGTGNLRVEDAEWNLQITKHNANPFILFEKPYFMWKKTMGFVVSNRSQNGILDYENYKKGKKNITVQCGPDRDNTTHSVKVELKRK